MTKIEERVFSGCSSLESAEIPESVTSIGFYTFEGCGSLKSIKIPNSVTNIDGGAFYGCGSLVSIEIPEGVTSIGYEVFEGCGSLKSIKIPDSVTKIEIRAFYGCDSLESIEIPEGVTSIGEEAFYNSGSLVSVEIPEGVTAICDEAFYGCVSLENIKISDSVTSIGNSAFCNTAYYNDELNWENGVLYISNHLIEAKTSVGGEYVVKDGTKSIAYGAFRGCKSLTSIKIPEGATGIGAEAFYNNTGLESIEIPDSVMKIGNSAFYNTAYYNNELNWENGILYIGNHLVAAKNRKISSECVIKSGTKTIAADAFGECGSLTSIKIPDSVTRIGEWAFFGCDALVSIEIPKGVTSIEYGTFYGCNSLETVYYNGSKRDWRKIVIDNQNDELLNAEIIYLFKDDIEVNDVATGEAVCSFEVEINENLVQEGILCVGVYDKGDALIGASIVETESTNIFIDVEIAGVPDSYKVFLWESSESMKPMAEVCEDMF